jgi:radical SAM superfamily enzyme YgiQ (UPF0313 family)
LNPASFDRNSPAAAVDERYPGEPLKALLVYPKHPPLTYWSFSGSLPYIKRRASLPPLSLATLAAMLPEHWNLRLIDMNIEPLRDVDLLWADVVMTSTMVVQADSLTEVVQRCNRLGVPVAAGGPHPSSLPEGLPGVDHLFIGEAEGGLDELVHDLEQGRAKPVYRAKEFPDVDRAPVPRFDLLDLGAYASVAVQHSRGCPFSCEFCDIWKLYGRRHRVKSPERLTAELDALHEAGWRGTVFFVDDNFIGAPRLAKRSLRAIAEWQREHGFPFQLYTEASLNLGSDDELMGLMREAGFNFVFLGIETPSVESLLGANKPINAKLDLLETVRRIQANGLEVSSGFIVGFDEDTENIFDRQIAFIREAGIPIAMVGILTAIRGTELYDRLRREGRLLGESYGNNTHAFEANFVTRMPADRLAAGYKRVMHTLYDPTLRNYFGRCRRLLDRLGPNPNFTRRAAANELGAFARSLRTILTKRYGRQYLRFLTWCALRHPSRFAEAVRLAIQGFHFEEITREALACDAIRDESSRVADRFRERMSQLAGEARRRRAEEAERIRALVEERARALRQLRRRIRGLAPETRAAALAAYGDAVERINALFAEHAPTAARAFEAGSKRLAKLRASVRRDVERIRARYVDARERAGRGVADLNHEVRSLYRLRRAALKRARRRVRRLPREYRPFGRLELQAFRNSLDDLLIRAAATPA